MRAVLVRLWVYPLVGADPASVGNLLLGIAALFTAIGTATVYVRDRKARAEQAEAARQAAETGEDDSYVSRSLRTMEESQKWLKEENNALRRRIDELDRHIVESDKAHLLRLRECQSRCEELSTRLKQLEQKRP